MREEELRNPLPLSFLSIRTTLKLGRPDKTEEKKLKFVIVKKGWPRMLVYLNKFKIPGPNKLNLKVLKKISNMNEK